ncbi:class I SAM-dependent methyltransferase [Aquamicrobium segne]|uniref:Class I SAM-dependent methyltransferase n=1 Tax=Aquamicrobium segne TaxID=469547 RepID=A0ABW0GTY5_9HYPH
MMSDSLKTLFYPFETGALDVPGAASSVLFLGAVPGFRLPQGFGADLHCVQGFRPQFNALHLARHKVTPQVQGEGYAMALVLAGRHRGQNELWIAQALEQVIPGGTIIVAGLKENGIASLRKRMAGLIPLVDALPKYHGIVFWLHRPATLEVAEKLRANNPSVVVESRFHTTPGMFSFDRVDAGSRLLVENLPVGISGDIADFCAGWGFLAAHVAERATSINLLDLYEADFEALEAARRNVPQASRFFWQDLTTEPVEQRYDWIVMNPPFHQGRAAEPDIGKRLIEVAAKALKQGGRLLMVANRQLPYEAVLSGAFVSSQEIGGDNRFKLFLARK